MGDTGYISRFTNLEGARKDNLQGYAVDFGQGGLR